MTDTDYIAWFASAGAIPMLLVEVQVNVGGAEITRYLSTHAYVDGVANQAYDAVIADAPKMPEKLTLSGDAGLQAGDIAIYNCAGERDGWLQDIWSNRPVTVWSGDPRWPRANFRQVYSGIVADIDSSEPTRLNIKLRDKLQRLNSPVSEVKLGGTTANKDELLPVALGEVHNITPLLTDPTTLEYQVHVGAIESIIEVRDNAKPVAVTPTLATGKFKLNAQSAGAVTVSVQGDKPSTYANTIAQLIQRLVTGFGKITERFTAADIDAANFAAFDAANPQPVGLYLKDRENVLNACQQLAGSVGAQLVMSRMGQLRLMQLAFPAPGTPTVIGAANVVQNTMHPVERSEVKAGSKVGFCQNWTVQNGLVTTIPEDHKKLYETEWLTETAIDTTVQVTYRLHGDPEMRETCLQRRTDAAAEAQRDLNLHRVPHTVYEFQGYPELFLLEVGAPVTLSYPRYSMQNGVPGVVVSFDPNYLTGRVTVGVMV